MKQQLTTWLVAGLFATSVSVTAMAGHGTDYDYKKHGHKNMVAKQRHQLPQKVKDILSLGGTPVTTAPYSGVRSEFSGSDLIVNASYINQDLYLLQQREKLDKQLQKRGEEFPDHAMVLLSGLVEGTAFIRSPFDGAKQSDIDLTSAELDVAAEVNPWASGLLAIAYSNADTASATRVSNSNVRIDRAYMTFGSLTDMPVYSSIGQMYLPFGQFSSTMVTSPMTKLMGRVQQRAWLLGFKQPGDNGVYGSLYAFKGETKTSTNSSRINQWGANLGLSDVYGDLQTRVAVSYISNLAEANGFQATGGAGGASAFRGFRTSDSEVLAHLVPGYDVNGQVSFGPFKAIAEYVSATKRFSTADLTFNGSGAKPRAVNAEFVYRFKSLGNPSSLSVGYGKTWQALGLNLPEKRYSANYSLVFARNTVFDLEFAHDKNYGTGDSASGATSSGIAAVDTNNGLGKVKNSFTAQVHMYF